MHATKALSNPIEIIQQRNHTLLVIKFCHILAREGTILVKILDSLDSLRLSDPKLRDLVNLWSYKLIMT